MYANDYKDMCMPLAYWSFEDIGTGPVVYWWGTNEASGVDYASGFVWPALSPRCPGWPLRQWMCTSGTPCAIRKAASA